jgi:hypothetical protein
MPVLEAYHSVLAKERWQANSELVPLAERGAYGTGDGNGAFPDRQVEKRALGLEPWSLQRQKSFFKK